MEIHLSTQANTLNKYAAKFWKAKHKKDSACKGAFVKGNSGNKGIP
jgi:hypothetical protein